MKKYWYPLDNAAKIYPPNTNASSPFVFSFTARLNEEVDPEALQQALNELLLKRPTFKTRLKRGIFWYYLESNNKPFIVKPQPAHYLKQITPDSNNGYLFEIFYRNTTVTANFYHALTDGTGGVNFFIELLFEYFKLRGYAVESEGVIRPSAAPYVIEESDDPFRAVANKKGKQLKTEPLAYKFKGTPFNHDGCGIIMSSCPVAQVKEVAAKYGATITEYLSALYMYSIYTTCLRGKPIKNKRVNILVPINLRKRYLSNTVRNFALFLRLKHDFKTPITFEECITLCKTQMVEGSKEDVVEGILHSNVQLEKNPFLKITPLFLKDIVMRLVYLRVGENLQSGNLSNLGLLKTPKCFEGKLLDITFLIAPTKNAAQNFTMLGYDGRLYITSARGYVETRIEREFFSQLAKEGIDLTLYSNYWETDL